MRSIFCCTLYRMLDKVKANGSKAEVFHGSAKHTTGGLKKKDLMKTRSGRIVSRRKHAAGKHAIKRLFSAGYKPKKGSFKLFHKNGRKTRRRRGGAAMDVSGNTGIPGMAGPQAAAMLKMLSA